MIEIERPKIEIAEISENGTYGKFVVVEFSSVRWHPTVLFQV